MKDLCETCLLVGSCQMRYEEDYISDCTDYKPDNASIDKTMLFGIRYGCTFALPTDNRQLLGRIRRNKEE